jgi:glucose-6-phosphate isomerase
MSVSFDKTGVASALEALKRHSAARGALDMRAAFGADPERFTRFSASLDDLTLDYSKCAVDAPAMRLLQALAVAADVTGRRDAMFAGAPINTTEGRAVLHTALRNRSGNSVMVDGHDVMGDVRTVLDAMAQFSEGLRRGSLRGHSGKAITDVVNIGIGGSDLGPAMATLALAPYHDGPRCHFVSNVDGAHITDALECLVPATTLFIIASKTFTTIETMTNAKTARDWVVASLGDEAVAAHFAAVSTALGKVDEFGIAPDRVFGFWDWVGGRYSIWSAIGLPLMIAIGADAFGRFLDGAHAMDRHFVEAPPTENLPILLGLIGVWHRAVCGYLQQLDMESNGKSVTRDGDAVDGPSGPIVWGEPGTNGQHAFFQLLHQGTNIIPVEFVVAANGHERHLRHQHDLLLANCFAQSEALMKGRTLQEARSQMEAAGADADTIDAIAPHRVFAGNRPSITLLHERLTPYALGRLIALYEHRVFVEAQIFGINAFDQWGVELGKELATGLLPVVIGKDDGAGHDASTRGLIARMHELKRK